MKFAFILGREYRLSLAEIISCFPDATILSYSKDVAIVDGIDESRLLKTLPQMGGVIKVSRAQEVGDNDFTPHLLTHHREGKFHFAINTYGEHHISLKSLLLQAKSYVKSQGYNPRFLNTDFKNISSATTKKSHLIESLSDFSYITLDGKTYFGPSIWVQDIDAYSERDYGKKRNMYIGMLPPKLAQMMINLGRTHISQNTQDLTLYDPFVGLGTVLIEGVRMGITHIYGSDNNQKMVEASTQNLKALSQPLQSKIFFQNAKYISEVTELKDIDLIVTEGYLGEIMSQNNISQERIEKQILSLTDLYEGFFLGLKSAGFQGVIVISFPFWEMRGKYFYFTKIYDILNKYTSLAPVFPESLSHLLSKSGSLLYKRPGQLVGREIFVLKIR